MKGLPLGLHEPPSGFWKRSTDRDGRVTSYHAYVIMRPIIFQKRSIVTKVCRIVTKVCRVKSVWQPKIKKCLKISCNFSRQGYASDFRPRQSFLTIAAQLAGDVEYPQQAPSCCVAFVLLGVRGTHMLCAIRSNLRQNYESIAAHLSDKSHAPAWVQRAERAADGGVVDVLRAFSVSPSAPRINAQRVARFDPLECP